MSATNRYRNVSAVGWTPSGGSLTTLTGIKSVAYDEGNDTLMEGADFDAFPTVGGVIFTQPKMTVESIDAAALYATVAGAKGTFTYTLRDYFNGSSTGGGAKIYTMSNAFLGTRTQNAQFNQLATQSLTFMSLSVDGVTHPVAVTAA